MISIIVCNQASQYLNQCLRSVVWQEGIEYEVVVVDYGMDPPLGDVSGANVIRWDDPNPKWNHARARNIGIANSGGDVLCFLNSDCMMAPDMLAWASSQIDHNQVFHRRFQTSQRAVAELDEAQLFGDQGQAWMASEVYGKMGPQTAYGDFCMVERAPVEQYGGFDERCAGWGNYDTDLACRLQRHGYPYVWGIGFRLVHLWHPERAGIGEDWRHNVDACGPDWIAGRDIRNRGPDTFGRYYVAWH